MTEVKEFGEALVEVFDNQYQSDDERWSRKGANLMNDYAKATPEQREAIDNTFITLCGWSLHTLIDMVEQDIDEEAE